MATQKMTRVMKEPTHSQQAIGGYFGCVFLFFLSHSVLHLFFSLCVTSVFPMAPAHSKAKAKPTSTVTQLWLRIGITDEQTNLDVQKPYQLHELVFLPDSNPNNPDNWNVLHKTRDTRMHEVMKLAYVLSSIYLRARCVQNTHQKTLQLTFSPGMSRKSDKTEKGSVLFWERVCVE
jgi:hypothetical protein